MRYKKTSSSPTNPLLSSLGAVGLLLTFTMLSSGCSVVSLKQRELLEQREAAVISRQQEFASQQQELANQQQELETKAKKLEEEKNRLAALHITLEQQQNRLDLLARSPIPNHSAALKSAKAKAALRADNTSIILGELEYVYLSPPNIQLSARIDTGVKTSALNALDLVEFERDGEPYARFNIINPRTGDKIELTRRIIDRIKIKEHAGDTEFRPVVKIQVRLGDLDQRIEMTLVDRSDFKNQVLIGRNFLRDYAIVDVSKKYLSKPVIGNK